MAQDKTELAENRTNYAEDRTALANERTYAGWMRTGFASVAIGLGFNALFARMEPVWVPKAIASAFMVIGIVIFLGAQRRACSVMSRLETHSVQTVRIRNLRLVTAAIIIAIAATIAALWLLKFRT